MFRLLRINRSPKDEVPCCFWCRKPKDKSIPDSDDLNGVIFDYDPCPECEDIFNKGILVIGVTPIPVCEHLKPIAKDQAGNIWYPDATYLVASPQLVFDLYEGNPKAIEHTLATRRLMMPSQVLRRVIEKALKEDSEDEGNQSRSQNSDTRECD